jgi:hypothetical protein
MGVRFRLQVAVAKREGNGVSRWRAAAGSPGDCGEARGRGVVLRGSDESGARFVVFLLDAGIVLRC